MLEDRMVDTQTDKMNCSTCGKFKEENDFTKNEKTGNYYKVCNTCRQKKQDNREKLLEQSRKYHKEHYQKHRDKELERQRQYREQHWEQRNGKVECDVCGSIVSKHGMAKHKKTNKCKKKADN